MADDAHQFDIIRPFVLKYEGGDADRHIARADLLGHSILGAAKYYNALAHFCVFGFVPRGNYRHEFECYAKPIEPGSIQQLFFVVGEYGLHAKMVNAAVEFVFGQVVEAVKRAWSRPSETTMIVTTLTDALLERARGDDAVKQQLAAGLIKANDNLASLHEKLIDQLPQLAQTTRPHGRRLVMPVGPSCRQLVQMAGTDHESSISEAEAEAIRGSVSTEVQDARSYRVNRITELNLDTGHCLMDVAEVGARVVGRITDPLLQQPGNPYSAALHDHSTCVVNAKLVTKDGDPYRLFVSDIE